MNLHHLRRLAFGFFLLTFFCRLQAQGQTVEFTTLHSFVYTNGTGPAAGMVLSGGILYGTTQKGGENGYSSGYGSVFKLNTDGSGFSAVRVFTNGPDGGNLPGDLVLAGNTLYGPAFFGGSSNYGTIFGIGTDGTGLTNLFNFPVTSNNFPYTNGPGAYPEAGFVLAGNDLYGTANSGGADGWGTIFSINTNGAGFRKLHDFNITDGQYPGSPFLLSGNTLYGSTASGGSNEVGTIFKLGTDGSAFTNLYSFSYVGLFPYTNSDGANPLGRLTLVGNSLYGTTASGGSNACGTIFKIDTNGSNFTSLYFFSGLGGALQTNGDGANPQSGLLLYSNKLYGTAMNGGNFGNGTIFRLNLDGSGFTTLYHFTDTNNADGTNVDGAHPIGGLVESGSALYGTANVGGSAGFGTVFSLLVPPPLYITKSGTNIVLNWPADVSSFSLESATNLTHPVIWAPISGQYAVTNPITGKQIFYRLTHP